MQVIHRFLRSGPTLLLLVASAGRLWAHQPPQTEKAPPGNEIPEAQLHDINRVPPSSWRMEGAVAASDMARLLLRREITAENRKRLQPIALSGGRDYRPEYFDSLNAPDLIKLQASSDALTVRSAPGDIIMMSGYGYVLPLVIRNDRSDLELLTVNTPWRDYEFPVPGASTRGFCLNLGRFLPEQDTEFSFRLGGLQATIPARIKVLPTGRLKVRLQDRTDEPAAARIYLNGADGLAHMPRGAAQRIARESGEYFFYAEGEFEVVLPQGAASIEAVRGVEYAPVKQTVVIPANAQTIANLSLDHRFQLKSRGWYSGDAHIHANYIENEIVDIEDIYLQVSAEGLDIANLMVANSGGAIVHDERFFEGKPHAVSRGSRVLYWNEEMRNRRLYGHMSFFNLKELVHPLYTGFPGTEHWEDYPPNFEQAKKARDQDGAVTYVHPAIGKTVNTVGFGGAQEFPVDLVLGEVDALDVLSNTDELFAAELWYQVLNTGLRCALSAGSDSFTNFMMHWVPGGGRVYVHVPGSFSYQSWIDNYRSGRSFVTNGPLLDLDVDGKGPGEELDLSAPSGSAEVGIEIELHSLVPVSQVDIVVNGAVVSTHQPEQADDGFSIRETIRLDRSSWIAARALGPGHRLIMNDPKAFAHTGAVFCHLNGDPIRSSPSSLQWVEWIDQLIVNVRERGAFASEERRQSVIDLFRKAQRAWGELAHP